MSDWVWSVSYPQGEGTRIVLADRDTVGGLCDTLGAFALNLSARSWPWRIGLGRIVHRTAEALLGAAERHTRTVTELPADGDVLAELASAGLLGEDGSEL